MKARYLFIIAFLAAAASVWQIIYHQHQAQDMAAEIIKKDDAGTLQEGDFDLLKNYVGSHMGVSIDVFLEGSYNRAVKAVQQASGSSLAPQVYVQAQAACAGRSDSVTQSKCVSSYINQHSQPSANPQPTQMPDKRDYIKSFSSTGWTADSSGLALLVSAFLILVAGYKAGVTGRV